jgi:hypothetical protein
MGPRLERSTACRAARSAARRRRVAVVSKQQVGGERGEARPTRVKPPREKGRGGGD